MFNVASILAAVTLSLVSTNDYRFTSPGTTNLCGKGMGKQASYRVPRAEDIAFLREAYAERACLLSGTTNVTQWESASLVTGGHVPSAGYFMHLWPYSVSTYSHYAFHPTLVGWSGMDAFDGGWGDQPKVTATFVSPSFAVASGVYETGPDYTINGHPTENDLTAFVDANDALPASLLATNTVLGGVLRAHVVAGLYSNLCFNAKVIHDAYANRANGSLAQPLSSIYQEMTRQNITNHIYTSYQYTDTQGRTWSAQYESGYQLSDPSVEYYVATNTETLGFGFRMNMSSSKETHLPYSYRMTDREQPKKYKSVELPSYHYYGSLSTRGMETCGKPLVRSGVLDVATNYTTQADCLLVIRCSLESTETWSGSTMQAGSSATTNHWVLVNNATIRKQPNTAWWEVDFDLSRIKPIFDEQWVGATSWPTVDVKNPEYMDSVPQSLSATHKREQRVRYFDLHLYVTFAPQFRARVIE